jgi:hypothetical protein
MHKGLGPRPPASQQFIQDTPIHQLKTGQKIFVEITA